MRFTWYNILKMLFLFSLTACTEKIDLQLDTSYTRLVVEGYVSNLPGEQRVLLTTTSSYQSNEPPPRVTDADVTIASSDTIWQLEETESGVYRYLGEEVGVVGETYDLQITLQEPIIEETTFMASTTMQNVGVIDSVKVVYENQFGREYLSLIGWAQNPPGPDYYIFKKYLNGVCMDSLLSDWFIIDDRFSAGSYLAEMPIGYIDLEENAVEIGDTIMVEAVSISEDYYRFLIEANNESGMIMPGFSGPPANVVGNISGDVWGYFAGNMSVFKETYYEGP